MNDKKIIVQLNPTRHKVFSFKKMALAWLFVIGLIVVVSVVVEVVVYRTVL